MSPDKIKPHLLRCEISRLNPGDWFHVGGDPLFDPTVFFVHRGKSQVNHFVGEHPVRGKLRWRRFVADAYEDSCSSIAEGHTTVDAFSFERSDSDQDLRYWKTAVVGSH